MTIFFEIYGRLLKKKNFRLPKTIPILHMASEFESYKKLAVYLQHQEAT